MTEIVLDYKPRHHFMPFHEREERWASLVVHRRGGKTVACVNELITRAAYTQKHNARYAYIAPFYRQAKDVAWVYLKEFAGDLIKGRPRESELRIELLNGAWITLYGADNPDALRGLYFDGAVLDEFGDCRPSLWGQVVLPTLVDRKGWAVFIGTPKGKNHFYDVHQRAKMEPSWYSLTLPADTSGILDEEELREMQAQMTESAYKQEMLCDFDAAVQGTFYADQLQDLEQRGRITPDAAPYDPAQKVMVACDLGFSDSTAFWFWQARPDGFAVIDYYENQGEKLPHYFKLLESKGYDYETIWLPHDARAQTLATRRSTVEQMLDHFEGSETHVAVVPKLAVQHGIDAVRLILESCWFNQVACYQGIEALRAYRRTFDEIKKVFSDKPLHDWSSDGSDAFRYMALACKPMAKPDSPEARTLTIKVERPKYTLDKLWQDREPSSHKFAKLRM
jgi:phage terminase large subunit